MTRRLIVVTGTNTDVGKTVATAALAATHDDVLVVKPVQTGILTDTRDTDTVRRLAGVATQEWTSLDEPLAPDTAARRQGATIPRVQEYVDRLVPLTSQHATVIVEGAGGLLVRLDAEGGTLLDLADLLAGALPVDVRLEIVLVCSAGLGTLNHTELTVGALRARGLDAHGLVIGAWPAAPGLAETCNLEDLPRVTGVPLLASLPAGAGALDRAEFRAAAPRWFRSA
ncbi:ATP-dependent dethiobiotin synthetase BioD [Nocardioides humilatus]|uniref:ATP-dependent dethiobiotin synthetase BioD n=1 Tax=Nocardioides humilatus TaxID=2607660 RepID=A0A5B1LEE1_9ACTN|nr:dethiobiotin synthase [Nocardioides humilatus]KAA1418578.1 ATP-dependent dethiobiotin synthetase BioD [Nocardioides humilatus]